MSLNCPSCQKSNIKKSGFYYRRDDSRSIQRYRCKDCLKYFSRATFSDCYYQKKRRVNDLLYQLLCSAVSMRRCALIANVDRKTVHCKLIFLGLRAQKQNQKFLETLRKNPSKHIQFDDLITKEHSKLKPLSITTVVDPVTRKILGAKVSQIPAFGKIAKIAKKKYGKRKSHLREGIQELFENIKDCVQQDALIRSDQHKTYPVLVRKYFPKAKYQVFKGDDSCVVGQGELKKNCRDPLWGINHCNAMLRDNIRRLVRKTWCITKDPQMLQYHLDLYISYHNSILIKKSA